MDDNSGGDGSTTTRQSNMEGSFGPRVYAFVFEKEYTTKMGHRQLTFKRTKGYDTQRLSNVQFICSSAPGINPTGAFLISPSK